MLTKNDIKQLKHMKTDYKDVDTKGCLDAGVQGVKDATRD